VAPAADFYRCVVLTDLRWRPLPPRKAVCEDRESNQAWREVGVHDSLPTRAVFGPTKGVILRAFARKYPPIETAAVEQTAALSTHTAGRGRPSPTTRRFLKRQDPLNRNEDVGASPPAATSAGPIRGG
jgi:hypothetical protein